MLLCDSDNPVNGLPESWSLYGLPPLRCILCCLLVCEVFRNWPEYDLPGNSPLNPSYTVGSCPQDCPQKRAMLARSMLKERRKELFPPFRFVVCKGYIELTHPNQCEYQCGKRSYEMESHLTSSPFPKLCDQVFYILPLGTKWQATSENKVLFLTAKSSYASNNLRLSGRRNECSLLRL